MRVIILRGTMALAVAFAAAGCGDTTEVEELDGAMEQPVVPPLPVASAEPQPTETEPTGDAPIPDTACGANELGDFVNLLPTSIAKADIAATVGAREIRYIENGQAVDASLVPERLNVELGVDGRIKRFRCG